jgi:HEAT repeat protein
MSLDALLESLEDPREEKRLESVRGLSGTAAPAMVAPLRRAAALDPSGAVRAAAAKLADQLLAAHPEMAPPPPPAPPPPMANARDMLTNPDPHVRAQAARSLIAHPDPLAAPLLAPLVRAEQDRFLLGSLMLSLAACGRGAHSEVIDEHLKSPDPRTRSNALEALESTGDPGVIPRILPFLHDPHHRVRGAAASAVRPFHPEPAIQALDAMLRDPEEVVVRAALFSLRFFDGPTALTRLRVGLIDGDRDARRMARESLKFMIARGSAGAHAVLLLDPEPEGPPPPPTVLPPAAGGEVPATGTSAAPALPSLPTDLGEIRTLLRAPRAAHRACGLAGLIAGGFGASAELLRALIVNEIHPYLYETAAIAFAKASGPRAAEALDAIAGALTEGAKRSHLKAQARHLTDPPAEGAPGPVEPAELVARLSALPTESQPDAVRRALKKQPGAGDALQLFDAALSLGLPETFDLAIQFALDKDRKLRLVAIEVLGELGSREAAETLAGLARDHDADVSVAALMALAGFDPVAARDAANELLSTGEALTMRRARVMLARLGDSAAATAAPAPRAAGPGATPLTAGGPNTVLVAAVVAGIALAGFVALLWLR